MQFQVPQFIETEAKIIGPLTLKQFFYVAGAGVVSFITFFFFTLTLWIIVSVLFGTIAGVLAFGKYNGQPVPRIIGYALRYLFSPHLFLWQRTAEAPGEPKLPKLAREPKPEKTSSLKNLWFSLQTTTRPIQARERLSPAFGFLRSRSPKERLEAFRRTTGEREVARRIDYR